MSIQSPPDELAVTIDTLRTNFREAPEPPIATFTADTALEDGFFRIVFLASLDELSAIYDDVEEFTAEFRSA